jgi:hypothetical protein
MVPVWGERPGGEAHRRGEEMSLINYVIWNFKFKLRTVGHGARALITGLIFFSLQVHHDRLPSTLINVFPALHHVNISATSQNTLQHFTTWPRLRVGRLDIDFASVMTLWLRLRVSQMLDVDSASVQSWNLCHQSDFIGRTQYPGTTSDCCSSTSLQCAWIGVYRWVTFTSLLSELLKRSISL